MNILFLAKNVTLSGRSGDAVHVREVAGELSRLGNSLVLVGRDMQGVGNAEYSEYRKALSDLEADNSIEVSLMSSGAKLSFPLVRDYRAFKNSAGSLRSQKIDVIYSRSFNAYLEVFLGKLFGVPVVLEINGLEFEERKAARGNRNVPGTGLLKSISKAFFRHISALVSVTEKIRTQLISEYAVRPGSVTVISNGVNERMFKPSGRSKRLMTKLKISPGKKVVCFVGAFDPWHGLEGLAKAARLVIEKDPDVVFLMVGDGIMRPVIEKKIRKAHLDNNFMFTGRVPYEDVPAYINHSDVCTIPFPGLNTHLKDSSPLKLYEYLSCGKPVVSTDVGGVAQIIKASGGGVLVKPDDPGDLARGILELVNDKPRQKRMGAAGRKYVLKNCTWRETAKKVMVVCNKVLKDENR